MIAKLVVWAKNRDDALLRLQQALADTYIVGIESNTEFLSIICQDPDFKTANLGTRFIELHPKLLEELTKPIPNTLLALASLAQLKRLHSIGYDLASCSEDINSPWFQRNGWRLHSTAQTKIKFWYHDQFIPIMIFSKQDQYTIHLPDKILETEIIWQDNHQISIRIDNDSLNATVIPYHTELYLFYRGKHYCIHTQDPKSQQLAQSETETHLSSPMPGTIVEVSIKPEQTVKKGEKLLVLEAMKMEHQITAPADGTIKSVNCQVGDAIVEGIELIEFERNPS